MTCYLFKKGIPSVRVSEVINKCFYCNGTIPAKNKEHIFNSCWAGSHKTSKLICDQCNNEFSRIDGVFAPYTQFIMNAGEFKGERHRKIPEISLSNDYFLASGANLKLQKSKLTISTQADQTSQIRLVAPSKTKARQCLLDGELEKNLEIQLTDEQREYIKDVLRNINPQSEHIEALELFTKLKIEDEYRSTAHTILKCLGLYTPEIVCDNTTKSIRDFARHGKGKWNDFAVVVNQKIPFLKDIAEYLYHVCYNAVEVYWCQSQRKIIGILTILGRVERSIVLVDNYQGPDAFLSVVEATDGSGKIKPYFVQFDSIYPMLSSIEIDFNLPTSSFLEQNFQHIVETSIYRDAFLQKLDKLDEINQSTLQECKKIFSKFISNQLKILQKDTTQAEIKNKLDEYGFDDLSKKYMRNSFQKNAPRAILDKALISTIDYFIKNQE